MELVIYTTSIGPFTAEEARLIEKARRAVGALYFDIEGVSPHNGKSFEVDAGAVVFCKPLRLDFRVFRCDFPEFESFVGPQVPLTDETFEGLGLSQTILEALAKSIAFASEHFGE